VRRAASQPTVDDGMDRGLAAESARDSTRALEPARERLRGLVGSRSVERHQGCGAGASSKLSPPSIAADRQHFNQVRTTVDCLADLQFVHGLLRLPPIKVNRVTDSSDVRVTFKRSPARNRPPQVRLLKFVPEYRRNRSHATGTAQPIH
jgi:hypothetical protein